MIDIQKRKERWKRYYQKHKQQIIERNRKYVKKFLQNNPDFYKGRYKRKAPIPPPEIGCEHHPMLRYETKYQIYINGQVWSYKGRWKKSALQSNGRYLFYCLSVSGHKNKTQYIHKLIVENFILNDVLPENYQIHHIDKNPKNNSPSNLRIVDPISHKQFHKSKPRN